MGVTSAPDGRIYAVGETVQALSFHDTVSFSTNSLSIGNHAITAVYEGNSNFAASTSSILNQAVLQPSTIQLVSSSNPSGFAQDVVFTATVSGIGGPLSGTVTFFDGSNSLGSASLSGNRAILPISSLSLGLHTITAVYGGDSNFTGSTSSPLIETVNHASTITISSSSSTTLPGQSVSFTANVGINPSTSSTLGGTVTFMDGSAVLATGHIPQPTTWSNVPSLPAGLVLAAATTGLDGRVYVMGGYNGSAINSVMAYDPNTNIWTALPGMPTPRYGLAAATGPDGRIYVIGGFNSSFVDTVEAYDPNTNRWSEVAKMPIACGYLTATTGRDGRVYAIGGYYNGRYVDIVNAYNPSTDTWSNVASMPTARMNLGAATGADGLIYAIGGVGDRVYDTVEAYNPISKQWITVASMPTAIAQLATVTGADGQIYAIGGTGGSDILNTVRAYDPASDTWTTLANVPTPRRGLAAAMGLDGRIYAIGGSANFSFSYLNTVEALTFSGPSLTVTTSSLTTGYHEIFAVYEGNSNSTGSTSPILVQAVGQQTTTTLASSSNPSDFGQSVTFTATVIGSGGTPSGEVSFLDGDTPLGTSQLQNDGTATITTAVLTHGTSPHTITAVYGGDSIFLGSTSAVFQTVNKANTAFSGLTHPTITYGTGSITVSGHLGTDAGQPTVPAGETVKITLNNVAQDATLNNNGDFSVVFATSALGVAGSPYEIGLSYAGDGNFNSAAGISTLTVTKASQSILFTLDNSVSFGAAPITLSASGGGSGIPPTFSIVSGPGTLNQNILTFTGIGSVVVEANQLGNANFTAAPAVQRTIDVLETTPPTAGTVNDGSGTDITYQVTNTTITANWTGFSDTGSGIASYQWAIGTTEGGTDVQAFTSVGAATNASASGLSLHDGTKYFVSVRAIDNVGNVSSSAVSDGVTVVAYFDEFTRTDSPNLGANWTIREGSLAVSSQNAVSTAPQVSLATANGVSLADAIVKAAVTIPNVSGSHAGLITRYNGPNQDNYYLGMVYNNNGVYQAYIFLKTGTFTQLAVKNLTGFTGSANLRFEVINSSLKFFVNDSLAVFAYDSTLTTAGSVGLRSGQGVVFDTVIASAHLPLTNPVTLGFSDDFATLNYDGTTNTQTPTGNQLGAAWKEQLGNFTVASGTATSNAGLNIATLNGLSASNVVVSDTVTTLPIGQYAGLVARYSGPADANMYWVGLTRNADGTSGTALIYRNVNGIWTFLGSKNIANIGTSPALRFEVVGTYLTMFVNNTVAVATNDAALTAGSVGLRSTQGVVWMGGSAPNSFSASVANPVALAFSDSFNSQPNFAQNWRQNVGNFTINAGNLTSATGLDVATLYGVSAADVVVTDTATLTTGQYAGLVARYSGPGDTNMYWAGLTKNADGSGTAMIYRNVSGVWTLLSIRNIGQISGAQDLRFEVINDSPKFFVNGVWATSANDTALTKGSVGLRSTQGVAWTGSPAFTASLHTPLTTPTIAPTAYSDDFSSTNAFFANQLGLNWRENVGNFTLDTNLKTLTSNTGLDVATLNGLSVADVVVSDSVKISSGQYAGLVARYSGSGDTNMYWAGISNFGGSYTAYIYLNVNGVWTQLASKNLSNITGPTQALRFEVVGSFLSMFVNGTLALSSNDSTLKTGSVGLRSTQGAVWTGSPAFTAGVATISASLDGAGFTENFNNAANFDTNWRQNVGNFALNAGTATSTTALSIATVYGVSATDVVVTSTATLATGQYAGLVARYSGPGDTNMYWAGLTQNADGSGTALLYRNLGGAWTLLSSRNIGQISGAQNLRFEVINDSLKFFVNGVWAISANASALTTGSVGLRSTQGVESSAFNAKLHSALATPTITPTAFSDNFSSTDAVIANQLSLNWRENVGNFTLNTTVSTQTLTTNTGLAVATLNGVSQADVVVTGSAKTLPLGQWAGLVARYSGQGDTNMYWAGLTRNIDGAGTAVIYRNLSGNWVLLSSRNIGQITGTQYLRFEVVNDSLKFFVNGNWAVSAFDSALTTGSVGVRSTQGTVWTGTPNVFMASVRAPLTTPATPVSFSDNFSTGYNVATNVQDAQGKELGLAWKEQVGAYDVSLNGATGLSSLNVATLNASQTDAILTANVTVPVNQYFGLAVRYSGSGDTNMYWGAVSNFNGQYTALIYKNVNGNWSFLGSKSLSSFNGLIEFDVIGSTLTLKTDGVTALTLTDTSLSSGKSGIRSTVGAKISSFNAS